MLKIVKFTKKNRLKTKTHIIYYCWLSILSELHKQTVNRRKKQQQQQKNTKSTKEMDRTLLFENGTKNLSEDYFGNQFSNRH